MSGESPRKEIGNCNDGGTSPVIQLTSEKIAAHLRPLIGPLAVPGHDFRVREVMGKRMAGIEGFKLMWETQLPQLSERIKTNWYSQLSAVATSETPAAASEAAFIAKGYVIGLLDAEVIDEAAAGVLGTYLVRIEQDAMARLRSVEILKSKDFRLEKNGRRVFGTPEQILPEVNEWLSGQQQARVISIESLFQNGCSGVGIVTEFAGMRVWYSESSSNQ